MYGDRIDCVADKQLTLDRWYRPGLDLTRICHQCKKQNPYCQHPVIYPESRVSTQPAPEPTIPSVPPAETPASPVITPAPPAEESPVVPPVPAPGPKVLPPLSGTSLRKIETTSPEQFAAKNTSSEKSEQIAIPPVAAFIETLSAKQAAQPAVSNSDAKIVKEVQSLPKQLEQNTSPSNTAPIAAPTGVRPSPKFYQQTN